MRETLMEVLDEAQGEAMYTLEWLRQRVLWHLDPNQCTGQVFVSENNEGHLTGHTIVRVEADEQGNKSGLFSTTFVAPESRRQAIAEALLTRGERWMAEHQLRQAATYTDKDNSKLIRLFQKRGYTLATTPSDMVILSRELAAV